MQKTIDFFVTRKNFSKVKKGIPLVVIVAAGICLRLINFGNYPFGFDQVQLLENAQSIVEGDLTLIGPRTGPASMFTGPLIYYINSLTRLGNQNPSSFVVAHGIVITISLVSLYLLSSYALNKQEALFLTSLYALSPYFISLDRIPWNPSLLLLASSLVFFPLIKIVSSNHASKRDLLLIFLGTFLGYQAHFSGIFLILLVTIIWIVSIRKQISLLFAAFAGLIISLLPTLVFDYRNNWLNAKGLYDLLFSNQYTNTSSLAMRQINNLVITIENIGKTIFFENSTILILYSGLVITLIGLIVIHKTSAKVRSLLIMSLIWLLILSVAIGFYKGPRPEYYFIGQFVAITLIFTQLIKYTTKTYRSFAAILIIIFFPYMFITSLSHVLKTKPFSFGEQLELAALTSNVNAKNPGSKMVYDMKPTDSDGIRYLIQDISTNPDSHGIIHVIYPYHPHAISTNATENAAVWDDPRTDPEAYYISQTEYIIAIPKPFQATQILGQNNWHGANHAYQISGDSSQAGTLIIIDRKQDEHIHSEIHQTFNKAKVISQEESGQWISISYQRNNFLAHEFDDKYALFSQPAAKIQQLPFPIQIYY